MKTKHWVSACIATVLSFLLSYGSVGSLLSAFQLDTGYLFWSCLVLAVASGLCYLSKRGDALAACALALVLGYLWRRGTLVSSFETLAYVVSLRYDGGYGWGTLGSPSGTVTAAVLLVGADIALSTARTVCRRGSAVSPITVALLPFLACAVVTDTVPGEGYLGCLLVGMILLLMTQSLRRSDPHQANTLTAMVALPLILGLMLLFWLAPKERYVNRSETMGETLAAWAQQIPELWEELTGETATSIGGTSAQEQVDLTNQGPKTQYTYTVMTVTAPTTGALYLRGQDYDSYTGTGWIATESRKELFAENADVDWAYSGEVTVSTRRNQDIFYYPYYTGQGQFLLEGGRVANPDGAAQYALVQYALPQGWETTLSQLPDGSSSGLSRYRTLPEDTRQWAEGVLEDILTGEQTDTEIAQAIGNFVRGSAKYDLNTPKMEENSNDFARWFLEKSDTGYCVHFATAAAVLLRAAGVEARYVTGYMVWTRAGVTTTVTAERSHAWVEYYESRLGVWVVLEATAGMEAAGDSGEGEQTATTEQTEQVTTRLTQPADRMEDPPTEPEQQPDDTDAAAQERRGGHGKWLLVLCIPGVAIGQYALRRELRHRRFRQKNVNRRVLAMWQEVVLLGRLLKRPVPRQLHALAQKARFSQHTLSVQEQAAFDSWLREANHQLRAKPWYWKLLIRTVHAI